jgi:hypothetical protein
MYKFLFLISFSIQLISCDVENSYKESDGINKIIKTPNKNIKLFPVESGIADAEYKDLELGPFGYENEELKFIMNGATPGTKTPGSENRKSQISGKGLYLHVVLNDTTHILYSHRLIPYQLPDGVYKMVAFVSRSYHESVKSPKSYYAREFQVKSGRTYKSGPLNHAVLAYAVPSGIYTDEETENVMLDFYLHNTNIEPGGNRVRILIDNKKEFFVDKWQAYYINGLGLGEHELEMELQNKNGQRIYGPLKQKFLLQKSK